MLARFNFKNYRSFSESKKEERKGVVGQSEEFAMIPGGMSTKKDRLISVNNENFLRLAVIYGANASGKSNFIKAADFMKKTVIMGTLADETTSYFRQNDANDVPVYKDQPSYFEMEIVLEGKHYAYGFEVILSQGRFISEWLIEVAKTREKVLFLRDLLNPENSEANYFKEKDPSLHLKLSGYFEDLLRDDSQLFLTELNRNKVGFYSRFESASIFKEVYEWFKNKLVIVYPNSFTSGEDHFFSDDTIIEIVNILHSLDTGILDARLIEVSEDVFFENIPASIKGNISELIKSRIAQVRKAKAMSGLNFSPAESTLVLRGPRRISFISFNIDGDIIFKNLNFIHEDKKTLFDLSEESDGTLRILDLMEILIGSSDKTFFIDELDRSLHPELVHRFIDLFFQYRMNTNTQLVFTCHDQRLMDFNFLRRDEIWLTQRRIDGSSHIYSLEEFNIRNDQRIDKAYRENRYGGVPVFLNYPEGIA